MRTTRLLPVSPSMHCSGGVPARGVCTCLGGCTYPGGCTCPGTPPPPVNRILTHASENITLPQTSFAGSKNDGRQRRPHGFHVYRPLPLPDHWIRYCLYISRSKNYNFRTSIMNCRAIIKNAQIKLQCMNCPIA